MRRRLLALGVLLAGCASGPKPSAEVPVTPPESAPLLAPRDEPGQLLQGFETVEDLRGLHLSASQIALGPEGVTEGQKALKITAVPAKDPRDSHGVRMVFAPSASWVGMHELAVDVTNPEDAPEHVVLELAAADTPLTDRDHRRKAGSMVPAHATVTLRMLLAGEDWGPLQPLKNRSGRRPKDNGVEIDLSKVHWLWILVEKVEVGQSFIVDNLRLVKRDASGVAISPAPPAHRPKLAVMDTQDLTGDLGAKTKLLTELAYDEAAALKTADVIGSADIAEMLGFEKQKALLGCSEGSCMAELGGALGADYLLTSQVGKLGTRVRVDARLVDARKGKVLAVAGDFAAAGNDDAIADLTQRMVRKVLADSPVAPKR